MTFHNDTNYKRVAKIMETLELISKSGNSNGADREDFQQLLEPVIREMSYLSPAVRNPTEEPTEQVSEAPPNHTTPKHIAIREAAQTASFQDLSWAMAVFLSRLNDELK